MVFSLKIPEGMVDGMPAGGEGLPVGTRPGGGGSMPDRTQIVNISKDNFFWKKYTISKK